MQEVSKTTSVDMLLKIFAYLKTLEIDYGYAEEDDGTVSCWSYIPNFTENEPTLQDCLKSLCASLRDRAYEYMSDFDLWVKGCPAELPYIIKILLSSDEELIQCLHGKN